MTAIRIAPFLLLANLAFAQQVTPAKPSEPTLPFVDDRACPLETDAVQYVNIEHADQMYSSWREKRAVVARLLPKDRVMVLRGVNVVREPDRAVVLQPIERKDDGVSVKTGDTLLRYGLNAAQYWELWTNGKWFVESENFVVEKGAQCDPENALGCTIQVVKNGTQEWWIEVKTKAGQKGWVLGQRRTETQLWTNRNFADLCGDEGGD
jgi:hypothetical protein